MDQIHCCETCKFFEHDGKPKSLIAYKYQGSCHRYPPKPFDDTNGIWRAFPPVDADDWCGEHSQEITNRRTDD